MVVDRAVEVGVLACLAAGTGIDCHTELVSAAGLPYYVLRGA